MHGQVWEWCLDPWHRNYKGAPEDGKVWDEKNNNDNYYQKIPEHLADLLKYQRAPVIRGGSWLSNPRNCRSACRFSNFSDNRVDYNGFRVACGVP